MTIEKANEIAMNWRMQPGTQHFVLDVQKADELFREWWGGYLARDEEFFTKIGARAEFEEFAKTTPANQIDAPLVLVYPPQNDRPPALVFLDGRHRFGFQSLSVASKLVRPKGLHNRIMEIFNYF